MSLSISDNERERWNQKYREAPGASASMAPIPVFEVRCSHRTILPERLLFAASADILSMDGQRTLNHG
jgi:hypothetical protein